jgi:hypothetical protein
VRCRLKARKPVHSRRASRQSYGPSIRSGPAAATLNKDDDLRSLKRALTRGERASIAIIVITGWMENGRYLTFNPWSRTLSGLIGLCVGTCFSRGSGRFPLGAP